MSHTPFDPDDMLRASQLCEQWRLAIQIEGQAFPDARQGLNAVYVDLHVARDLLADCARETAAWLDRRPPRPDPPAPATPAERT